MKNREKFRKEILNFINKSGGNDAPYCDFARKNVIPNLTNCTNGGCAEFTCSCCRAVFAFWLGEEYEEPPKPEVDWDKVPVDTLVRVRDFETDNWRLRYFAGFFEYDSLKYATWNSGRTSKTVNETDDFSCWRFCELVEDEDDGK